MAFLKELEKLSLPAPTLPDLEDDNFDGPSSEGLHINTFSEEKEGEILSRHQLIKIDLSNDSKYKGEKVSRKKLFGDFTEISGLADYRMRSEMNENEQGRDGKVNESVEVNGFRVEYNKELMGNTNSDDNSEPNIEASFNYGNNVSFDQEELDCGNEVMYSNVLATDVISNNIKEKENKKASAVRCQLATWEQLLYLKIKLQAAIRLYNQLPRGQFAKELLKNAEEETKENYINAKKNVRRIILLLLEAEHELLAGSPLIKSVLGEETGKIGSDDEEITSSEDEQDNEVEVSVESSQSNDHKMEKKFGWRTVIKIIQKNEEKFTKFRNLTLTKWDERTRLTDLRKSREAKKDFSAFENGIVQHIDRILLDKPRLLKRSQTKRSENDRIGGDHEAEEDPEIYDDDDFYQILLKELIDKKTSKTQDPACMTRHYIEMQKLKTRRSRKQVIDNRASKERKIKYVIISKLVNFHPAKPEIVEYSHESRNELFKSLFS
uniref:Protein AATF n=1 Tax=Heterorhabditis bacteriophora TaxID=37862 RepID=A0A1I7XMV5_HETBA